MLLLDNVSANKEQWHELRKGKIGASDAYDAADIDDGSRPLKVWQRLVEQDYQAEEEEGEEEQQDEDNSWADWGHRLEPVVAQAVIEKLRNDGNRVDIVGGDSLYRHSDLEWAIATPDFLLNVNGELVNLQIKTRFGSRFKEYVGGIPNKDRAQCVHELGVMRPEGFTRSILGVFFYPHFPSGVNKPTLESFDITAEEQHYEELFRREQELVNCAKERRIPAVKVPGEGALLRFWEMRSEAEVLEGEKAASVDYWADVYNELGEEMKNLKATRDLAKGNILELIGETKKAASNSFAISVVRAAKKSLSGKRIKEADETLYEMIMKKYGSESKSISIRVSDLRPKTEEEVSVDESLAGV